MDFALTFVLVVCASGLGIWVPSVDATVLIVDTSDKLIISLVGVQLAYPTLTTDQNLFVCTAAGKYDCAFAVTAGHVIYMVTGSVSAYKVAIGYTVLPDPSQEPA